MLPWFWSSFIAFISLAMLLSIIQKMTEKVENVPCLEVESWAFETIKLFTRLKTAFNLPCLFIIGGRYVIIIIENWITIFFFYYSQIIWIFLSFLAFGLGFGSDSNETLPLGISRIGYGILSIYYLLSLRSFLFLIHSLNESVNDIKDVVEDLQNQDRENVKLLHR